MAQLVVRDLDPDVKRRLQQQAARHGRSMEAEVRSILAAATAPRSTSIVHALREAALSVGGVDDLKIPERTEFQRKVDLG